MNDLRRVDLNLLVILDALLSEQHVTRAAERLHLSQPAVSHALGRLRDLLGDPLLVRQGGGLVATARALELAAPLADALAQVQSLLAPMRHILDKQADFTLIEGAGGWRVPLADQDNLSDLAMALDLPVILVVGVRLGCINHALLTAEAIARDGLQLAGWVANIIEPKTSRLEENLATLAERLPAPCLGRVPKLKVVTAEAVAEHLQLDLLD